jgi:Tfp pilus assembly protein PilX
MEAMMPFHLSPPRQRGIALPVMLIMLTVLLISSIYLLRSTTSTTLTTSNLAYEAALSKSADLGLHTAFDWLSTVDKGQLMADRPASGYVASLNPAWSVRAPAFWQGSTAVFEQPGNLRIEYVIHRMCTGVGDYNAANSCTLTSAKRNVSAPTQVGDSLSSDAPAYQDKPQLHYVITARVFGTRGGNVVNQTVVMMGP